ncbi:hypothetical protein Sste5346_007937 [Sporothrix stenoceras]|uniref:ceramidase n=1 Tax=Sporothrix stenoceras TaxID=5173 RepID=A0ABR3YSV8_9PEZI
MGPRSIIQRVYDDEEQAEIEGIAEAMEVPIHLLVALNVMVDMMMGCSTMGLKTVCGEEGKINMLHLRIMDWHMPRLRRLMVELSYVRQPGGPVIASSLSYLGYVGVFTGVRPGLSMSINFRAHHGRYCVKQRMAYHKHQLQVMMGKRRSLSSYMRQILLASDAVLDQQLMEEYEDEEEDLKEYGGDDKTILEETEDSPFNMPILDYIQSPDGLCGISSTAAYLTFCTPETVIISEKDHRQAEVFSDNTALAVCNHDRADVHPAPGGNGRLELVDKSLQGQRRNYFHLSMNRQVALETMRKRALEAKERRRMQRNQDGNMASLATANSSQAINFSDVVTISQHPIVCHEDTHYIAIMDPARGRIVWRMGYS